MPENKNVSAEAIENFAWGLWEAGFHGSHISLKERPHDPRSAIMLYLAQERLGFSAAAQHEALIEAREICLMAIENYEKDLEQARRCLFALRRDPSELMRELIAAV